MDRSCESRLESRRPVGRATPSFRSGQPARRPGSPCIDRYRMSALGTDVVRRGHRHSATPISSVPPDARAEDNHGAAVAVKFDGPASGSDASPRAISGLKDRSRNAIFAGPHDHRRGSNSADTSLLLGESQRCSVQCCSDTIAIGLPSSRHSLAWRILLPKVECFQDSVA